MAENPSPKAHVWHRMRQFLKAELLQLPASTALLRSLQERPYPVVVGVDLAIPGSDTTRRPARPLDR